MSNITRVLSPRNPRVNSVEYLVTEGLGYCCLYAFFSLYTETELIALRLGVTSRAIRYNKERFSEGEFSCCNGAKCLKSKL